MKRLSPSYIRAEFGTARNSFENFGRDSGFADALQQVSLALGDLQEAGIDVSLEIFGDASELAFDLFEGGVTVPISGVLRIGPIHRLFGIATKAGGKPALQIGLSNTDIRFNGPEGEIADGKVSGKVRPIVFDLKKDPEALIKFQREILVHAARNSVIAANDPAQAFNDAPAALRKPALPRPKTP
ncbi:MAG TPA: hypothetical protein VEF76_11375 [Patescibacteria group bacterium]|nr:hypothetical protein [Patescibacteria group bacterium]